MERQVPGAEILDMSAAYNAAMKGDWGLLKDFYKEAGSKPVTLMFDTVLHIVAHSGQAELMEYLIHQVSSIALHEQNDVGNTVLYEAATSGDVRMAKVVLEAAKEMLNIANMKGETPLFGAVAYGHTQMVRYLAEQYKAYGQTPSLRRDDGTSILHIAILGQYHDTALELLMLYRDSLVTARDEMGLTGLHLLSSMPFAFRSGCSMGFFKKLIYSCIPTAEDGAAAAPNVGYGDDVEAGHSGTNVDEPTRVPLPSSSYSARLSIASSLKQALHRINVDIWNFLSHGWPPIRKVCEEKNKHALAIKLVKKLVAADMSWMDSHIGGDPNKISVFNQGTTKRQEDKNLHSPSFPLVATHGGVLSQPSLSPNVINPSQLPSESPIMGNEDNLQLSPKPPTAIEDDNVQLSSKPLMVIENDSPQCPSKSPHTATDLESHELSLKLPQLPPKPPLLANEDDNLQFSSMPPMVINNDNHQRPSKSPCMGTDFENYKSPSKLSPIVNDNDGLQFPSRPPSLVTNDGSIGLPLKPPTISNDHHLPIHSEPPMKSNDDNTKLPLRPLMLSNNESFQFPLDPSMVFGDNYVQHRPSSDDVLQPPMNNSLMGMADSVSTNSKDTPLLIAAGKGIVEIVEEILAVYPQAVEYINDKGHNILHVAVQHRQTKIFKLVCSRDTIPLTRLNRRLDNDGNSILHHAAKCDENDPQVDQLKNIPGEALQMQWEIQWFKQVKDVVPPHFRYHLNKDGEKADEVFTKCHKELAKNGEKWLMRTANSCSLVATLIATVAFTSAYTVPGGPNQNTGHPVLLSQPAFLLFTVSDTISLSFALTSVVVFLSIMTSRFHEQDFHLTLPLMLVVGLSSLFLAVSAMMVSFAATLVLMITQKLRQAAIPIYLVACFPVTIFLVLQFPLYVRVAWSTIGDILHKFHRSFSFHSPNPRRGFKEE